MGVVSWGRQMCVAREMQESLASSEGNCGPCSFPGQGEARGEAGRGEEEGSVWSSEAKGWQYPLDLVPGHSFGESHWG